jgi:hypothetical protein
MLRNTKSSVCSAARVYSSARRSYSCVRVGTAWLAFTRMKPDTLHRREALPLCRRALLRGSPAGVAQTLILGHAGDLLFDARSPCCSVANAGIATLEGPALMKVRTTSASVRPSIVMRSRATDGRSASKCPGEWPDQTLDQRSRLGAQ